jgi:hypothetical protein
VQQEVPFIHGGKRGEFRRVNIKSVQLVKRLLPVVFFTLGAAVIVLMQSSDSVTSVSAAKFDSVSTPNQTLTRPVPIATPHVVVNGQAIPLGSGGIADVTLAGKGSGETQVQVSDGHVNVTTAESGGDAKAISGMTNNTNVSVSSQTNGNNDLGATSVYSTSSNTSGNSSSFSSHQVFSTGSNNVDVTSP